MHEHENNKGRLYGRDNKRSDDVPLAQIYLSSSYRDYRQHEERYEDLSESLFGDNVPNFIVTVRMRV
jgi:hypothetical protein